MHLKLVMHFLAYLIICSYFFAVDCLHNSGCGSGMHKRNRKAAILLPKAPCEYGKFTSKLFSCC